MVVVVAVATVMMVTIITVITMEAVGKIAILRERGYPLLTLSAS